MNAPTTIRPTDASGADREPRGALHALTLAEARLLLRSRVTLGAALLACALGIALSWTRMLDWESFADDAGAASLILAGGLFLAGHLAATRDRRYGATETLGVLPAPTLRRAVSLFAMVLVAPLLAVLVAGVQLLSLWPYWPVGPLDWWAQLIPVAVPLLAGLLGVAVGQWLPGTAAGPLALVTLAALVLTLPAVGNGGSNIGAWMSPLIERESWETGAPRPTGWHLLYVLALAVVAGAVTLLRHRRTLPILAGTLALAVAALCVQAQLRADVRVITEEMAARYTGPATRECERHHDVEYCALRGYRGWIPLWREAVDPIAAALPPTARPDLPQVRQYGRSYVPSEPVVRTSLRWGRHESFEMTSRIDLATTYAAAAVGLPTDFTQIVTTVRADSCWGGGQARTVVALWLAGQALPDGERRLRANELSLHPVRYGQPEVDAALALLALPRQQVTDALAAHWDEVTRPVPASEFLASLGAPALSAADQEPTCP